MIETKDSLTKLKGIISKEGKTVRELNSLLNYLKNADAEERNMIFSQINALRESLKKTNEDVSKTLGEISLTKSLHAKKQDKESEISGKQKELIEPEPTKESRKKSFMKKGKIPKEIVLSNLEKEILKRLKKKEKKIIEKKVKKPSKYVEKANKIFSDFSISLLKKKMFQKLEKDLIKTNLQFTPISYTSTIFFTTLISAIAGVFIFLFFLFFNLGEDPPFITLVIENMGIRFLKVFWILFVIPIATFLIMYFYPSLEKKSTEYQLNQELPFAVIHMSAISSSMLEPSKIFSIIIATKEYPYLEKEFIKLINEIHIYGYDLVTSLRSIALNTPSKKLADLFNSLATTITSGGDLAEFFEKRSESLLFEHRLEREKYTKTAETFMDIYISVVIAAPMILMLLLMMMKISGLGIAMSGGMITLMMVLGVSLINILFLTFLHLKQPKG